MSKQTDILKPESPAGFAAANGYAAWWAGAWQRKLDLLRSVQHVDNVCGIRWGESYRTHHNAVRSRAMIRRELAKERMRHTEKLRHGGE